jgi:PAS domain S-box-containing protein
MVEKNNEPTAGHAGDVRKRAEAAVRKKAAAEGYSRSAPSPEAALRLVHELQVHQIELEMQNEELTRAHAALEVSNARYFDLYDMAPVGYFSLSEPGTVLEANLTAAGLLGVARSELVHRPLARFILPEDQHLFIAHLKQFFAEGPSQTFRLRMLRADAAPFWAQLEASAALDATGAHVCRAVMSDITEIRRAEEEHTKVEAHLAQIRKDQSLGLMAGAIAHHFNDLLQTVMGNLELAMKDLFPRDEPVESLVEAMRAARRASEVSSLMLTYVGEAVGHPVELDLSEACRGSLPVLRATTLKDLVLTTDLPSPGPIVRANANQVQQVLTNLVANAWEAVGGGRSAIHLATRTVPAAEIPTAFRFPVDWKPQDAAYACLEVSEEGRGIPLENLERIFDPFFSGTITRKGLGLSVVLGIVRAHGGAVTVTSEPGKGSTFRVYLPLAAA